MSLFVISDTHFASRNHDEHKYKYWYWIKDKTTGGNERFPFQNGYNKDAYDDLLYHVTINRNEYSKFLHLGDIADTGLTDDIAVAESLLEELINAGQFDEVILLPGNHDRYIDGTGTPGGTLFDSTFNKFCVQYQENNKYGWNKVFTDASFWSLAHDIQFIAFDFCLKSRSDATIPVIGVWGQGKVCNNLLDEVANLDLINLENSICLTHFPPVGGPSHSKLIDGNKFLRFVEMHSQLILCGHTHEFDISKEDNITIVNVGTTTANPTPSSITLNFSIGNNNEEVDQKSEKNQNTFAVIRCDSGDYKDSLILTKMTWDFGDGFYSDGEYSL